MSDSFGTLLMKLNMFAAGRKRLPATTFARRVTEVPVVPATGATVMISQPMCWDPGTTMPPYCGLLLRRLQCSKEPTMLYNVVGSLVPIVGAVCSA